MRATVLLEGLISVQAAVESGSRPISAIHLSDDAPAGRARRATLLARRCGCPLSRVPRADLDGLAGGRHHGGVVAVAGQRRLSRLDHLLGHTFLAMLDGVEDPYNFGQAVRALYAAGAAGILVGARDWSHAAAVVARASAGASERVPMAVVHDVDDLAGRAGARGLRLVCAAQRGAESLYAVDLTAPLLLVVGGERRGISASLVAAADVRVRVPYGRTFGQALDVTSATAAIAFEVARQRRGPLAPLPKV